MTPPLTNSLPLEDPYPKPLGPSLALVSPQPLPAQEQKGPTKVTLEDGVLKIDNPDGTTTIDFEPTQADIDDDDDEDEDDFGKNLAKRMDSDALATIATDLLDGIQRDEDSRKEWLETRALGIGLLGLSLEKPRSDLGQGSAPLEGMSTVRHPLLLEATVSFQATARAELLPASGPVKVRNDMPIPPRDVLLDTTAAYAHYDSLEFKDDLSQAMEKDFNHYLTSIATEYIPDTDRMLFYIGFGGDGFKKVYNCPLRRRPVSESVDAEDLIVSNAATDLQSCGRVTHHIKMRPSILRRMQIMGSYRDVDLAPPPLSSSNQNAVDKKKEEISGVRAGYQRPEDRDYDIYESYCELDLDKYAPEKFKGKGLPLPYRVTLEKESRQILDIRRNWKEDDDQCLAKQYFVQFPFIRGLGFYGLGFIHLLGNTTIALTAAWRLQLDSGMFASFPGFLFAKGLGRQLSNNFRVPPGGGVGVDIGAQQNIRDAIMPLPYKESGPAFVALTEQINQNGQRMAATSNINVGEGKQDAPVGTTLALIEQATKVQDSAHKRLHASQAEEFKLLKERFREDPEAFWRHNKRPARKWEKEQFVQALEASDLVPVADPNNPTSLHRIAKAMAIKTLQQASPLVYDPIAVDMRIMRIVGIDPVGLFKPQPDDPPPDPRMQAIQQKAASQQQQSQIQLLETQIKAKGQEMMLLDKQKDRDSREKVETMKLEIARLKVQMENIIHAHDAQRDAIDLQQEMNREAERHSLELRTNQIKEHSKLQTAQIKGATEIATERARQSHDQDMTRERHYADMERSKEEHAMKMEHQKEIHAAKLEAARALARAKPKPVSKGKK